MTVVTDPENNKNKCLKIEYTGDTQAYDYAPIFNLKLQKKLDEYSGIKFESRVVASNTGDVKYKTANAYFAKYGKITPEYYYATSLKKADAEKKGISEEMIKFSVDSSHASGKDENYTVPNKGDEFEGMVYNNHSLPMMYDDWAKEKKNENRTIGFKESESDKYKAGWHPNKMNLTKGNITETGLLNQKNVSLVLGSTYTGRYPSTNASLTLYIDNVSVLEGETPCTAVKIENAPTKMVKGMKLSMSADNFAYTPDNTTQTQLTWTSSDEKVLKVDSSKTDPVLEAVGTGKVTLTAAVTKNPSVTTSFDVEVVEGSHAIRSYEGTSYGEAGVEENWWCNWIDGVDSKNVKVDGTTPKGNLTNVRYVVLKANKFDANKPEHVYELKSLVFSKDWKENTNPTDKEIKANPEKYPEYK